MANTDDKSSSSLGATLPPSPSSSAAPISPLWSVSQTNHVQPQLVRFGAYRAIADLNRGFEQLTGNLQALQAFNFFPAENLTAWVNMLCNLQATANHRLIETIQHREMNNALYYDRLCLERERQLRDPDDVLLEAKQREQELME